MSARPRTRRRRCGGCRRPYAPGRRSGARTHPSGCRRRGAKPVPERSRGGGEVTPLRLSPSPMPRWRPTRPRPRRCSSRRPMSRPRHARGDRSVSAPPVCPYLGFEEDPATRLDYPDDRAVRHAAAANAGPSREPSSARSRRWGGHRSVSISPDYQVSMCLTATHQQCERYPTEPAAEVRLAVAISRAGCACG